MCEEENCIWFTSSTSWKLYDLYCDCSLLFFDDPPRKEIEHQLRPRQFLADPSSVIECQSIYNLGTHVTMNLKIDGKSIRSENYMITFEVEEEKFPFFGKKYQLKFASDISAETHCLVHFPSLLRLAREAGLENTEIQNLTDFYDDNRAQVLGILQDAGHSFIDPRGRLLPRSYDVLGLFTTFIFQKPDPDIAPPLTTPFLPVGSHNPDEMDWQVIGWNEEEKSGLTDPSIGLGKITEQKGILGPGPPELRFPEAI